MNTPNATAVASRRGHTAQLAWLLVGDVADLLEWRLDADSARWLLPVLETLRNLMNAEEQDDAAAGYLDDVVAQFPNAYERVVELHRLREELHSELHVFVHQLSQLLEPRTADEEFDDAGAQALKMRLVSWVDRMSAQHRNERELSQSIWYLELGLGD
ncbi:MAG: hypothetical protein ACYTGL_01535 [Planctomycetota bacterium]|jgi:hypothetical protein